MPNIFSKLLKMSLLSGLFVFIAFGDFTIYCLFLRFIPCNTHVMSWYSTSNTYFFQKQSVFLPKCRKESIELIHISKSGLKISREIKKHLKSTLLKIQYSKKPSRYTLRVLKSSLNNLKSSRKHSKALVKYYSRLHFPIFRVRYCSFSNLNPTL